MMSWATGTASTRIRAAGQCESAGGVVRGVRPGGGGGGCEKSLLATCSAAWSHAPWPNLGASTFDPFQFACKPERARMLSRRKCARCWTCGRIRMRSLDGRDAYVSMSRADLHRVEVVCTRAAAVCTSFMVAHPHIWWDAASSRRNISRGDSYPLAPGLHALAEHTALCHAASGRRGCTPASASAPFP